MVRSQYFIFIKIFMLYVFFENPSCAESHNVEWMELIIEVHIRIKVKKSMHHGSPFYQTNVYVFIDHCKEF